MDGSAKKKVAVGYKGKHFIIMDEDCLGDMDSIDPYVSVDQVIASESALLAYVTDCRYYGIPTYVGDDDVLRKRIDAIHEWLDKAEGVDN